MNPAYFLKFGTSKGFPNENIRIGMKFEVGGAYEDWGYVIYDRDQILATHKFLEEACKLAHEVLKNTGEA